MGTSNKNTAKTAAVMSLLGKGPAVGCVQADPPPQVRDIETITGEILEAKRAGGEAILTIGRGLIEAKALLPHGEWLRWLEERVEFSEKAAQRFMLLARKYSNPTALSDLGATKALMLLALPDEARDEFISGPHLVDGEEKTVVDMTSRELDRAIKERNEALKVAELAKAEQSAAEAARKKMAEDMALANERISGLNAEVEAQSARAREARDAAARLEQDLEELRSRPVDVAVQVDEKAVEAARKEAEAAMRDKLDKAQKAMKKAQTDLMEVNSALQRAKLEREQMEVELRKQLAQAEKKASLSANEDFVLFRTLFDQAQDLVNKLSGVMIKLRNKAPDLAEKMSKALLALAEKIKEVAQG